MLYFCRRGRQKLNWEVNSRRLIFHSTTAPECKATDELTKKSREDDESFDGGLMFEKPAPNCLVVSFRLYLKSPKSLKQVFISAPQENRLHFWWQHEDVWYDNMVVGERTLGEKMKNISREANFRSVTQTIQSGRQLSVTILDKSGFEARHIMALSGHKNKASVRSYRKTDICTKKKMSETLTTRWEVSEELIISSRLEITKNFNFFNCNVCYVISLLIATFQVLDH